MRRPRGSSSAQIRCTAVTAASARPSRRQRGAERGGERRRGQAEVDRQPQVRRAGPFGEGDQIRDGRGVGRGGALGLEGEDDAEPIGLVGDSAEQRRLHAERGADDPETEPGGDLQLRLDVGERLGGAHRSAGTAEQIGVDAECHRHETQAVDRRRGTPARRPVRSGGSRARPGGRSPRLPGRTRRRRDARAWS